MTRCMFLALGLLLASCAPRDTWDGEPTTRSVRAVQTVEDVWVPAAGDRAPRQIDLAPVRAAVARLAAEGSVSVGVLAPDRPSAGSLTKALIGIGVPPGRIDSGTSPSLPPGRALVQVRGTRAEAAACPAMRTPLRIGPYALEDPEYAIGCATATNFAAMLANPEDLVRPPAPPPFDAVVPVEAIDRSREHWSRFSPSGDSPGGGSSGGGSSGGGSSGGGASGVGAAGGQ